MRTRDQITYLRMAPIFPLSRMPDRPFVFLALPGDAGPIFRFRAPIFASGVVAERFQRLCVRDAARARNLSLQFLNAD